MKSSDLKGGSKKKKVVMNRNIEEDSVDNSVSLRDFKANLKVGNQKMH